MEKSRFADGLFQILVTFVTKKNRLNEFNSAYFLTGKIREMKKQEMVF